MEGKQPSGRLLGAIRAAWRMRWLFLIVFLLMFFLSYSALLAVDLVPNAVTATSTPTVATNTIGTSPLVSAGQTTGASALSPNVMDAFIGGEEPIKIEIPSIKLTASVSNPTSTKIAILDAYLMKGAVRYPTSGLLGEKGNVVIFGHSSYLPIVNSPAYKTFDGIQNLKPGDAITVYSSTHVYVYSVDAVEKKSANSDGIRLDVSDSELTLSTCDSFGQKSDRFVVNAHLVKSSIL
jgi:LPXTG-site transpeptidase (sortase) family protein